MERKPPAKPGRDDDGGGERRRQQSNTDADIDDLLDDINSLVEEHLDNQEFDLRAALATLSMSQELESREVDEQMLNRQIQERGEERIEALRQLLEALLSFRREYHRQSSPPSDLHLLQLGMKALSLVADENSRLTPSAFRHFVLGVSDALRLAFQFENDSESQSENVAFRNHIGDDTAFAEQATARSRTAAAPVENPPIADSPATAPPGVAPPRMATAPSADPASEMAPADDDWNDGLASDEPIGVFSIAVAESEERIRVQVSGMSPIAPAPKTPRPEPHIDTNSPSTTNNAEEKKAYKCRLCGKPKKKS